MEHKIGLHEIFGQARTGKEGPFQRANLLSELSTLEAGINIEDLQKKLGINSTLYKIYIDSLSQFGLISVSAQKTVSILPRGTTAVKEYFEPLKKLVGGDEEVRTKINYDLTPLVLSNLSGFTQNSAHL